MRMVVVAGAAVAAFALWIWLTGPGTSLPLALIGGLIAVVAGRLAYRLLMPRSAENDTAPPPSAPAPGEGNRDV
ncbi:hypothetical protein E0493_20990 [Roseomonas sp. M0104]|uniref:Uncharacterized protein n=1 Tax=Teichococcus coralli TaxID=2545983 RepID=A0A845BIC2_9PROT|nr:hypothetical protein [Pseudoroseomonas coralli]MXP65830.1 hypothetical protein [Pseudoroseomonas coralli]